MPEAIFAAKALNVLRLGGFKLELPSDGIKFSFLRELHLDESVLDEQSLQALCASCRDLEVLSFRRCEGLMSLQVVGILPKLRLVKLKYCPSKFKMVDILAPNLKDLYISSSRSRGHLNVLEIIACKILQCLKLINVVVTDQWLENHSPNLPNLEIVNLCGCWRLKTVKISSGRLKYIDLVD